MTAVDQDEAAERAACELALRVKGISSIADPLAFARAFIADMRAEHWRCMPPAPNILAVRREGEPPTDDYRAARAALERTDHDT